MSKKRKNTSKSQKESKYLTGNTTPIELDSEIVDIGNRVISENLINFAWCYDTNDEREAAIRKFVDDNAENGLNYEDSPKRINGIGEIVLDAVETYGLEEVLHSAIFHGVFNTIDSEDYIGSYFSFAIHAESDLNITLIANDMIDYWIAATEDSIVIFPYRSDKLNAMLRDYFENFKESIDITYVAPVVA